MCTACRAMGAKLGGGGKSRRFLPPLRKSPIFFSIWASSCYLFFLMRGPLSPCGSFLATIYFMWEPFNYFFFVWGLFVTFFCLGGGAFLFTWVFLGLPPPPRKFLPAPLIPYLFQYTLLTILLKLEYLLCVVLT